MATTNVTEAMPSRTSATIISLSVQNGPLLSSPVRTHGATGNHKTNSFRPYVTVFTIPMNGHEQPYGMPASTMVNLHSSTSTFTDPMATINLPL